VWGVKILGKFLGLNKIIYAWIRRIREFNMALL
jgi:hypothetical protein